MITLTDLIFPKICVGCQGEGNWLCVDCVKRISLIQPNTCPECTVFTEAGRYCKTHRANHRLDGLLYVNRYHEPLLQEAIHALKYENVRELAGPLGSLLRKRLEGQSLFYNAIAVPVPLHRQRIAERGFNQAELLAKELGVPVVARTLVRHRQSKPQATLEDSERITNMTNVFGIVPGELRHIVDKQVLLVDDVYTTGATLEEAAVLLRKVGAKAVWGLVLAKS